MNRSIIYLTLALLVASATSFTLKTSTMLKAANAEVTKTYRDRSDMPCATVTPSLYKAFQFVTLKTSSTTDITLTAYKGVNDATLKYNLCSTQVKYDSDCDNVGAGKEIGSDSANYGFLKTKKDETTFVCHPIYNMVKDNTYDFTVTAEKGEGNRYTVKNVQMIPQIKSTVAPVIDFKTSFSITCGDYVAPTATADESGNIIISITDQSACGHDISKFIQFFSKNLYLSILLILLSLPLIFHGYKFLKKSLAVIGFIGGAFVITYVATVFFNFFAWETKQWIIFAVVAIAGASLVATFCYLSPSMAIIAGGAAFGYFGGMQLIFLYSTLLKTSMADVYRGALLAVCIGLGVVLGWKLKKCCIILATAMSGSYLLVFGVGSLIGNYPDMNILKQKFSVKDFKGVDLWSWIYLSSAIVLFVVGAIYQFKKFGKKEDETTEAGTYKTNEKSDDYTGYY